MGRRGLRRARGRGVARRLRFPAAVALQDGGTLGLNLYEAIASARRVLVFDAIDFGLAAGTLRVLRDDEVPAWGRTRLSPHQTGFNDVLAFAHLNGRAPRDIVAIGVQPVELDDFGGSLRAEVKARLPEAVALAAEQLAAWGFPGTPRSRGADPAAECRSPHARRVRVGTAVGGRRLPQRRSAGARARRAGRRTRMKRPPGSLLRSLPPEGVQSVAFGRPGGY